MPDTLQALESPPSPPRRGRPPGTPSAGGSGRGERFKAAIAAVEPLAVGAEEAAALCGVGRSLWCELDRAGRIPLPLKLGARCVWSVAELRRWMDAGCPDRERWGVFNKTAEGRAGR